MCEVSHAFSNMQHYSIEDSAVEMKIQFKQWCTLARELTLSVVMTPTTIVDCFAVGVHHPVNHAKVVWWLHPVLHRHRNLLTTDSAVWKYFPLVIIPTPLSLFISLNVVVGGTTIYVQSVSWDGMDGWECCYIVVWAQSMFSFAGDHTDSDSQRDLGEAGNRIIFP